MSNNDGFVLTKYLVEDRLGRKLTDAEAALLDNIDEVTAPEPARELGGLIVGLANAGLHPNHEISLLRLREVLKRTGLGRSKVYQLVAQGRFPSPVRIAGARVSAWRSDSIDQWIGQQV